MQEGVLASGRGDGDAFRSCGRGVGLDEEEAAMDLDRGRRQGAGERKCQAKARRMGWLKVVLRGKDWSSRSVKSAEGWAYKRNKW